MSAIRHDKYDLSGRGSPARRGPGAAEPRPARPTPDPIEVLAPNEDPDCDHPCPTSRGTARVVTGDCWISFGRYFDAYALNSAGLADHKTLYDAGPTRYTTALPCLPTSTIAPTRRRQ